MADDGQNVIEVVMPTYIMQPTEDEKFSPAPVKRVIDAVLQERLTGKEYDEADAKEWSIEISEDVKARVKELAYKRYKIIVQVTIGELRDQGVRVASRCLWATPTDNYASSSFQNQSLWCTAMVFGVNTD